MNKNWQKVFTLTVAYVYLYVFMEWIFFTTKPSFMSSMNFFQKVGVFLIASFVLTVPFLLLAALLKVSRASDKVIAIFSASILALLALILFDNFTYTVWKFGVVTSHGIWRGVYALGLVIAVVLFLRNIWRNLQNPITLPDTWLQYVVGILFFLSSIVFVSKLPEMRWNIFAKNAAADHSSNLPNIVLFGWDGTNATHMSVYGYERDTTPYLKELAPNALMAENAFSNAGKTGGSLTSILTGKPSTETRVIFPPDILLGEDAYQHLPGILKQLGYTTVQITMPYYGDAYERNFLDAFDTVNFRSITVNPIVDRLARIGGGGAFYFVGQIISRITERLEHIFFIKEMENPYATVTKPVYDIHDDRRLQSMIQYLQDAKTPLFIQVHLMDIHGPEFYVPDQYFSAGETQAQEWSTDFYDDAIRDSDRYLHELFDYLSKSGKIDNTIVVLYSDHGMNWDPLDRVPLFFWFPNKQYAGRIQANVQLLDIAPTLLDYLSVPQPAWMTGRSLITENLPPARPIISAEVADETKLSEDRTTWVIDENKVFPPFYDLGRLNLVVCDKWFSLDLRHPQLTYGIVEGSTATCNAEDVPSPEEAKTMLLQHLSDEHYDTSTFPSSIALHEGQH